MIAPCLDPEPVTEWGEGERTGPKVSGYLPPESQHVRNVVDAVAEAGDNAQ